ncbi:glycerophosphodiester phosphodiesterase [Candidatus Thorarchaeota archaeon]|nr:MAG: glycerophosphodiester phosphodiesterase [Candidatus Thorarchaeota archaeon]
MMRSIAFGDERPLIMAHRGDPVAAPENSLLSMRKAVEIGVDFLETDVRMTRDNHLVLFHDETLLRTTGRESKVKELTLDEMKEIDLGETFSPDGKKFPFRGKDIGIVTLKDAFDAFPDIPFNLDIKDKDPVAPEMLASIIREYGRQENVIVASFHDKQLVRFRNSMPEVATSACPGEITRFVFALKMRVLRLFNRGCKYEAFQVPLKYGMISVVDDRFLQAAHERDVAVHVWTINGREKMEELIDLGVDGIFTDEPALLKSVLSERGML